MKKLIRLVYLILLLIYLPCHAAEDLSGYGGTIYFAWDGEAQSYDRDQGTANFTYLGGGTSNLEGDAAADCSSGSIDVNTYHYTILSNDSAGRDAVAGSSYSLKTPYDGDCNDESTSRDQSIITLASDVTELYIRWYQKFTGNWNNASVQHKLTKMTPKAHARDDLYTTGYFTFRYSEDHFSLQKVPNVDDQFTGKDNYLILFSTEASSGSTASYRYWDNYNNELGPGDTDQDFDFNTDVWYCIEMHIKNNSGSSTADAVAELWVDGVKVFGQSAFKFWGSGFPTITGLGVIEFQHIYYNRASNDDQPTYVDNIVIGSSYIGPTGTSSPGEDTTPPDPDPMTFSSNPAAINSSTISMTATTATDINDVQYFFTCKSEGCNNSGWISSPAYTDTGLEQNTEYRYTVIARDRSSNYNETGASGEFGATTLSSPLTPIDWSGNGIIDWTGTGSITWQ